MKPVQQLTPGAAHLAGLVFVVAGILPVLAAFDIGPPWLGFAGGGIFVAAGLAIIAGPDAPLAGGLFGALALAGLAAIGNWIVFGAGERACAGSISLPGIWAGGDLSGLSCRIPFGFGALITDAFLCWMIVSLLQKTLGGPPRLAGLLKAAEWLILASLAPVLLVLLVSILLSGAAGAVRTRWTTGAWPRNEAFIARQKAKGLLRGFARRPPDDST